VDTDGFTCSNSLVFAKGWVSAAGGMAVTLWNPTGQDQQVVLRLNGQAFKTSVTVPAEKATAVLL
jgi:hypothetical protein